MGWVLGEPAEPLNLPSSVSILGLTQIDFQAPLLGAHGHAHLLYLVFVRKP
jgi:hypothetical protein